MPPSGRRWSLTPVFSSTGSAPTARRGFAARPRAWSNVLGLSACSIHRSPKVDLRRWPRGREEPGWGQGPQHTKSLHTWFAHVPGLQVVMPGSPADAKGLLLSSIMSDDPTLFIEGRSLFTMQEDVPNEPYFIRLGEALVRRPGKDVTLITMGSMVPVSLQAAEAMAKAGIDAEVVDLRCLMPLDVASIIASVKKTGRLVVAEPGWRMYGAAAEIIATVVETLGKMRSRPRRVTWPHSAVPTSSKLEEQFYPTSDDIIAACRASVTES